MSVTGVLLAVVVLHDLVDLLLADLLHAHHDEGVREDVLLPVGVLLREYIHRVRVLSFLNKIIIYCVCNN